MTDQPYQPADGEECVIGIRARWDEEYNEWWITNATLKAAEALTVAPVPVEEPTEFGARAWVTVEGWRYVQAIRADVLLDAPWIYQIEDRNPVATTWRTFQKPTAPRPQPRPRTPQRRHYELGG